MKITCENFYTELSLEYLLNEYQRSMIEIEKIEKMQKKSDTMNNFIDYMDTRKNELESQINIFYNIVEIECDKDEISDEFADSPA
jgi:hypothetical protein